MKLNRNNILLVIFFLSIGMNFIFVSKYVYSIYKNSVVSKSNNLINKHRIYCEMDEVFEVLPLDANDIVFIGDSFIDHFPLDELFDDSRIKNRGIKGVLSYGVIDMLPRIVEKHPKKIFIYIGVNDIINLH